jgi:Flp pilus assembly protein TadG
MRNRRLKNATRRGVTIVECAVVYPAVFILLLGLVVGGMGVFRYQEVSSLARSAVRYASTHGAQYRKDANLGTGSAGSSSPTAGNGLFWYNTDPKQADGTDTTWTGDIYDKSVRPNLVALDVNSLSFKCGWPPVINQVDKADNWPGSRVSVTVSYQWLPEIFIVGPFNLTSTASMPITN